MQTAPDISEDVLAEVLRSEYDFDLRELQFWPHGEASYSFICSNAHRQVFLKLYDPGLPAQESGTHRFHRVLPLVRALAGLGLRVNIPIETSRGDFSSRIDGYMLVAFEYIDGSTLGEKPWTSVIYSGLGDSIGRLHRQTAAWQHLLPSSQGIAIPSQSEIDELVQQIETGSCSPRRARAKLARELLPRRRELYAHHQRLSELSAVVQSSQDGWVLCHSDLTGGNLIRSGNDVTIIDWDGVCLAPREFDLAFFSDEPFEDKYGPFLRAYAEHEIPDLSADAFIFRMYQRNIEDFVEGARFVLEQDTNDEELDHALEVALEDGVYDWRLFETGERKHREFVERWNEMTKA